MSFTVVVIGLAAGTMLVLALAMSFVLGWANHAFHVETDPRVDAVNDVLPAANCGACGYVGCNEYAEAVVLEGESINLCTVGGASCAKQIADILGVEVEETWPYRAVIHCAADNTQRKGMHPYLGEMSCAAANVISGVQGCTYGCLGFGDCEEACDFDAINMRNGLAEIDYEKCTGCKACAKVCPRNIITMVPFKAERMLVVACSNKDFGADVKKVCTIGCIGCKQCARQSDLFEVENNLAVIDYNHYDPDNADFEPVFEKCQMETLVWVGKPTEKDQEAVADEEAPHRVEADFKTTVDNTEWWG